MRHLTLTKHRPRIDISIDHHHKSKIYTSGSSISGVVTITTSRDITLETIQIALAGTSLTRVFLLQRDMPLIPHSFLCMPMPIPATILPETKVLKAGCHIDIPFTFVVPRELPTSSCRHSRDSIIDEKHRQLPPTLRAWDWDGQTPYSAQIEYGIRTRIAFKSGRSEKTTQMQTLQEIDLLPHASERPPLDITPEMAAYRLTQSTAVRQEMFSPAIGRFRVVASQPTPVALSIDTLQTSASSVYLDLEFVPTKTNSIPPDVHVKSVHIQTVTHHSLAHINHSPDQDAVDPFQPNPVFQFSMSKQVDFSSTGVMAWRHDARRPSETSISDSGLSMGDDVSGVESRRMSTVDDNDLQQGRYKTVLKVDFALPACRKKWFAVPTFHSCYISRVYSIRLMLSAGPRSTLSVTVPLQVCMADSQGLPSTDLPSYVSVLDTI